MKKLIIYLVICLASLLNDRASLAQLKTLSPPLVVILDLKEASEQSYFGKKELQEANKKVDIYKKEVDVKQKYINNLHTELIKSGKSTVTPAFYESELRIAQRFVEDKNLEIADINKKLTIKINDYMKKAVMAYAREKKYDIVLPSQSVYTVYEPYNITIDFINYLNKEYKNE